MTDRTKLVLSLLIGGTLISIGLVGLATGIFGRSGADPSSLVKSTTLVVTVIGILLALWHVSSSPSGSDTDAATANTGTDSDSERTIKPEPESTREAEPSLESEQSIATITPEFTSTDDPVSGRALATLLDDAAETAREEWSVEAGIDRLRPVFRETLIELLAQGESDCDAATAAIADGTWTEDPVAASVLSSSVQGPSLSFRQRLYTWLFPERILRERVRITVGAIADVAAESRPSVPGENTPRTVPVINPSIEYLQRSVDGSLELAVESAFESSTAAINTDSDTDTGITSTSASTSSSSAFDDRTSRDSTRKDEEDRQMTESKAGAGTGTGDGTEDGAGTRDTGETGSDTVRVRRWRGAVAAASFLAAMGAATGRPVLLLAAAVPLAYIIYGSVSAVEVSGAIGVTRRIDPTPVPPGHPARVTVTVRNEGDRTLPDLRVVDAVPEELVVVSGSPRSGDALDPGESLTIEYVVPARRGEYRFDPPSIRVRSLGASAVTSVDASVEGDELLDCRLAAQAPPLDEQGNHYVGSMTADSPGHGMEFHSIREYHPEDPADRIDWRHYAKRGELATVNYRKRLAATIILVVDARPPARVVPGPGRPTAVELSAYAATHALSDLLGAGHEVGAAVLGDDGPGPAGLHWIPPNSGPDHRSRARKAFETAVDVTFTGNRDHESRQIQQLTELTPPGAQLVVFSPLLDDGILTAVETWRTSGFSCSVLAPDVLIDNTVSGQFAQIKRRTRLTRCQTAGARTVDWRRGTPLPIALSYAFATDDRLGTITETRGVVGGDD